jgi:hypothetical protein
MVWSDDEKIGQATSTWPRLATFNGDVYMVHTGENDTNVWMSQLDTSGTWFAWKQDFLLPYKSWGSPAIAAYAGALYIVGATPTSGQLWMATMNAAGEFSAATDIPGQASPAGPPGLAAHRAAAAREESLYMAYRSSKSNVIVTSRLTIAKGSSGAWTAPVPVPNSITSGVNQQSEVQPALASYKGVLHMIHNEPALGDRIMWTYLDGASWSTEISIGDQRMFGFASMAALPDRLVMVHPSSTADHSASWPDFNTAVYSETFQ